MPRKPHNSVENPLAWRFSPASDQQDQNSNEPPPPYPIISPSSVTNYSPSIPNRQSPTSTTDGKRDEAFPNFCTIISPSLSSLKWKIKLHSLKLDYRKSPSSGIYSATSAGSPSPVPPSNSMSPHPISRSSNVCQIGSWQRKTHSPIIMQSVKSTQVQKPILQTAIAPQVPTTLYEFIHLN